MDLSSIQIKIGHSVSVLRFSSGLLHSSFCAAIKLQMFSAITITRIPTWVSCVSRLRFSVGALWASHRCYKEFQKTIWHLFPFWLLEDSWFWFGTRDGKIVLICQANLVQYKPLQCTSGYPIWNSWFEGGDQIKFIICQQLEGGGMKNQAKNTRPWHIHSNSL